MHHAATTNLQPTALPAHVHLGRRFGKREERWPEAHLHVFGLEIVLQEVGNHAFQVGEADSLPHPQAFNLVEHRRMGGIGIHAIDAPRRNDADVRHCFQMTVFLHMRLHVADLDRRGVRAQHMLLVDIEGVVHGARRMVGGDVQRGEVVKIVFDLRTFRLGITDGMEQRSNALQCARDRMQSADACTAPRQSHIQRLCGQLGIQSAILDGIALRI